LSIGRYPVRSYARRSAQGPARIRIRLSDQDARRLEDEYRRAKDTAYRDRLRIIRLASRDRPHQDIAADLGIAPRTVQRWLNRYLEHGLAGRRPRKAKGAGAKVPADLAGEVRRRVVEGPQARGLDRANRTHAELAEHLPRTHGIRASRSAMQRFGHELGIRVYRPSYRFPRADPEEQAEARAELAELKRGRRPAG
jgi:transposase